MTATGSAAGTGAITVSTIYGATINAVVKAIAVAVGGQPRLLDRRRDRLLARAEPHRLDGVRRLRSASGQGDHFRDAVERRPGASRSRRMRPRRSPRSSRPPRPRSRSARTAISLSAAGLWTDNKVAMAIEAGIASSTGVSTTTGGVSVTASDNSHDHGRRAGDRGQREPLRRQGIRAVDRALARAQHDRQRRVRVHPRRCDPHDRRHRRHRRRRPERDDHRQVGRRRGVRGDRDREPGGRALRRRVGVDEHHPLEGERLDRGQHARHGR